MARHIIAVGNPAIDAATGMINNPVDASKRQLPAIRQARRLRAQGQDVMLFEVDDQGGKHPVSLKYHTMRFAPGLGCNSTFIDESGSALAAKAAEYGHIYFKRNGQPMESSERHA